MIADCNKTNIVLWKVNFHILTYHKIISAQSAHIFNNDCSNQSVFNVIHHTLKVWTVKICACVTIICVVRKIGKAIGFSIVFQQCFLVFNASAFRVNSIIERKSDI